MRMTVLGCSGSYPGPDSPASSYLLEADDADGRTWRILVDLGNGALGVLHRYADPLAIDAVVISHLHADHCLDLCGYYVLRRYHPTGPAPRIPVWGPRGTAAKMARAYDLPVDPGMTEEFDFREIEDSWQIGPFRLVSARVSHPVAAFAFRIDTEGSGALVYTGDTGPCAALEELADGASLLLAEASFHHDAVNPPDLHLTGVEAGTLATTAAVERLVVTHVPPWHDAERMLAEARSAYAGPSELAAVGAVYEL